MQNTGLLGQLDRENSQCKDSGEKENYRHLGKEVRTKACLVGKIVKSWMKWSGHTVRMKDEIFPKRAETNTFKMGVLPGEMKLDLRKAEEEEGNGENLQPTSGSDGKDNAAE